MVWHTDLKENLSKKKKNSLLMQADKQGQRKKFKDLMRSYWQQYCEKSTIHGVRYIYDPTLRSIERLIWSALVLTCIILTFVAYWVLSERYSAQKMQTVVDNSQFPVFQVPFPAVGVCTHNRINWQKFEEAKALFLPPAADSTLVDIFTNFVERMETMHFGAFEAFTDTDDMNWEALDGIDVTEVARFMALRCEDVLVNGTCEWRRSFFNCCTYFIFERTEYGGCLVFNSELSTLSLKLREKFSNKYYPFHSSKAGETSGLSFQLKAAVNTKRNNSNADDTITILIKRSDEMTNAGYTIAPSTETYVVIRSEVTESDDIIRYVNPFKRNCYFADEEYLFGLNTSMKKEWILSNCLNTCHATYVRQLCNCTLPWFFLHKDDTVEQCRASHYRCLAKHNDIFSYDKRKEEDAYYSSPRPGMTCSCLLPCQRIDYYTTVTTLSLFKDETANDTSDKIFKIDVHYQSEVVVKYRTSLEFTIIDLIANFGGIFGLCLGASLVSGAELFYYLTLGFGLFLYDNNYFQVLGEAIRNIPLRLFKGTKNSYIADRELENSMKSKSSFLPKHPHRKENYW